MKRTSRAKIFEAGRNIRNDQALLQKVNIEEALEMKEDYSRELINWTPPKQDRKFKVGWWSFFKSIAP